MKKIYLFLLIIFGYTVYGQQKGISYQAVIINPNAIAAPGFNGTSIPIANKTICMSFQIINSNNQVEYQESQSITTDMYGMVNVVIGTGNTGTGLVTSLDAVNWSQGANKLVVSVNTEGVCSNYTEISNQLLNYTPYSLYAQNADIKDGYVTDVKVAMGINPSKVGLGNVNNTSDTNKPVSIATQLALDLKANATDVTTSLALKENLSNKSSDIATDATSTTKYPTVKAVKDYVDANSSTSSGTIVDADTITKGKIQLAGDLAGTADLPTVPGLVLKANTADVITALNLKANETDVVTALNLKSDAATVSTELALKLDANQKGVPNGLATLNSSGIIPSSQLPPVTISSTSVVGSDAAMTALSNATVGSIAIRTDLNKNYVLSANDPSIISNWIELLTPAAPVQTVNGYVGSVNLSKTDIDLSNVDNTSDRNKPISDPTQIALNLKSNTADLDAALALKINRTDVDAALNLKLDANKVGLSNGVASLNALGKIPTEQIPAISFSSVKVLSNQADMLALNSAVIGSVVIRTDVNKNYVLAQADPSNLANWIELLTPAPPVQSVNGYTGSVSLSKSDFDLANVNNTSDNNKPISIATQTALDLKANESSLAVVATTGDYRDLLNLPSAVDASSLSGTLAIAKGGTGSNTKNFVDLLTDQTISGAKTFTTNGTYSAALTVSGNLVAPNIGSSSVVDFTHRIVTAATTNTFTKLIQFGTGGLSGSNTTINIGSGISGANNAITIGGASSAPTTTTTINGNVILPSLSAEGIVTNDANGVLNTTTTLAVANGGTGTSTLTGLIRGNGIGAMTAAVAGTDYLLPTGSAASLTNFPILNQNTTGTASNVSGIVSVANGGTGATTARTAMENLLGLQPANTFMAGSTAPTVTISAFDGSDLTGWTNSGGTTIDGTNGNPGATYKTVGPNQSFYRDFGQSLKNKIIEFDIKLTSGVAGFAIGGLGNLGLKIASGTSSINGLVNQTSWSYPDSSNNTFTFIPGTWYTIKIVTDNGAVGGTSWYVNGALIGNSGGYAMGNGTLFGILTDGATAYYDNIVIKEISNVGAVPSFRAIVAADIPTLNQNTTGTASNVSGTVAVANGGTGTTTLTGLVKGNGNGVMTAAVAGTDYVLPTGSASSLTNFPILNQNTTGTADNVSGVILGANGGTGVANTGKIMTLGGNFSTGHALTFTTSGASTLSLPTSGTLATVQQLDAKELIANKSTATDLGNTSTSDDKYPSQKAVKTYVDGKVSSAASSVVGYSTAYNTSGQNVGENNVGVGPSTGPSNLGYGNTYVGAGAMASGTGVYNTVIGFRALAFNSSIASKDNVAIGQAAGYYRGAGWDVNNQSTEESIFIGSSSRAGAINQKNEIVIGYNAIGNGSNTIQLGNTAISDVKTNGKLTSGAVTYPKTHGASGQVLSTTGSGELAWITPASSVGSTYSLGLNAELGGYVFFVTPDGKHGLVVTTQFQSLSSTWHEAQNEISNPSNHNSDGKKFTDWRLPTKSELNIICSLRNAIGGFSNYLVWSSTSYYDGVDKAWWQTFADRGQAPTSKNDLYCVRAVRAF